MTDNHDDFCEAEFIQGPMVYSPCDCAQRAAASLTSSTAPIDAAQAVEPIDAAAPAIVSDPDLMANMEGDNRVLGRARELSAERKRRSR